MSIGTYNKLIINSKGREKMSILDELNEEQRKAAENKGKRNFSAEYNGTYIYK